jgi:hypothetical protein
MPQAIGTLCTHCTFIQRILKEKEGTEGNCHLKESRDFRKNQLEHCKINTYKKLRITKYGVFSSGTKSCPILVNGGLN